MKTEIEFGKIETVKLLDNEGSTMTQEENIIASKINRPVRKRYEIKTRVYDQVEEHKAYISFSDQLSKDKTKLDPAFRIEKTKLGNDAGYYYVISCYTQLEY